MHSLSSSVSLGSSSLGSSWAGTGGEGERESPVLDNSLKEGYLLKRSKHIKRWSKRYFALMHDHIVYFRRKEDAQGSPKPSGAWPLSKHMTCGAESGKNKFHFKTSQAAAKCLLWSDSEADRSEWLEAIRKACSGKGQVGQAPQPQQRESDFYVFGA